MCCHYVELGCLFIIWCVMMCHTVSCRVVVRRVILRIGASCRVELCFMLCCKMIWIGLCLFRCIAVIVCIRLHRLVVLYFYAVSCNVMCCGTLWFAGLCCLILLRCVICIILIIINVICATYVTY